jgi:hypothetical protein
VCERTNKKEKVVERVLGCWEKQFEMDETNLPGRTLKRQSIEKGNSWLNKIKQSRKLGVGISGYVKKRIEVCVERNKKKVRGYSETKYGSQYEKSHWYFTVN